MASCDFCAYNEYDEEDEAYYCSVNMDEDDMARFVQRDRKSTRLNSSHSRKSRMPSSA